MCIRDRAKVSIRLLYVSFDCVQAVVLSPSDFNDSLVRPSPRHNIVQLPSSDLHWELKTPRIDGHAASLTPSTAHTDSPNFNESWPSCSEQTSPTPHSHDVGTLQEHKETSSKRAESPRPSLTRYLDLSAFA